MNISPEKRTTIHSRISEVSVFAGRALRKLKPYMVYTLLCSKRTAGNDRRSTYRRAQGASNTYATAEYPSNKTELLVLIRF